MKTLRIISVLKTVLRYGTTTEHDIIVNDDSSKYYIVYILIDLSTVHVYNVRAHVIEQS